jgi:hypothetical protein
MGGKRKYHVSVVNGIFYYEVDSYKEAKMLAMVLSERTGKEVIIMDAGGYWEAPFVLEKYKYGRD